MTVDSEKGVSGWYGILPPPLKHHELTHDITTDWVVVGAGFAGLSAARQLQKRCPGDSIVVVDALRVGEGSSGRNSGFMIDLPHDLRSDDYVSQREKDIEQIQMNRAAISFAQEAVEEFNLRAYFSMSGKYHGAADQAGMKALVRFEKGLTSVKEDFTHLNTADMKAVTGSDFYIGGLYAPGAAILQPAGYIRGLAEGLQGSGVKIFEDSPVIELTPGPAPTVKCAKGTISAGSIILAVNGGAGTLGYFKNHLLHVHTYASMTRQLSSNEIKALGGQKEWALIPADPMGSTVRRLCNDRILIRNTFTVNPDMATSPGQVEKIGLQHVKSFKARFPMLAGVDMEYVWGGLLCLARNGAYGFGAVDENVFAAVCQNGLGVAKGTLSGMLIADLAAGHDNPLVSNMLAGAVPSKFPPEFITTPAARLTISFREWMAGKNL